MIIDTTQPDNAEASQPRAYANQQKLSASNELTWADGNYSYLQD